MGHLMPIFALRESFAEKQGHLHEAINAYESEMIRRAGPAVLNSRQACVDAHNYACINDQSPLISRRSIVTEE